MISSNRSILIHEKKPIEETLSQKVRLREIYPILRAKSMHFSLTFWLHILMACMNIEEPLDESERGE